MPWYLIVSIVLASVALYLGVGLFTEWLRYYVWGIRPKWLSYMTFILWPLAILWVAPFAMMVRAGIYERNVWTDITYSYDCGGFKYVSDYEAILDTRLPATTLLKSN